MYFQFFLRMNKIFYIYLVVLISIITAGCEGKSAKAVQPGLSNSSEIPAYGDTIIEGTIGEPSILIPMLAGDSASHNVAGLIFNGLVKYDTDLSVIGDLAESWDSSQDVLIITFYLRKGVKWTDGNEFTAEDVKFGFDTIINDKAPTAYSE